MHPSSQSWRSAWSRSSRSSLIVLALVFYLVSVILELRKITNGLDEVIATSARSCRRARRSTGSSTSINEQLDAGVDLLEGLLVKKAGITDAVGLVDGLYPGAAAAGFRNFPESTEIVAPRIGEVYTQGHADARPARPRGADRRGQPGRPVLRNVEGGSLAARRLYPEVRQTMPSRSRGLRSSAPTRRCSTSSGTTSVRRASGFHRRRSAERRAGRRKEQPHPPRLTCLPACADFSARKEPCADPASFEYERATSVEGAIASLQRLGSDARVIAGGHSLLPMMKLRLANPEHLIDINDLTELAYIREQGDEIRIGALTRHVDLLRSELLARHLPLFRDAEHVIADPVVRNRGTIGGSLCQADAAEDLSAVCSAVKAQRGDPRCRRRARRRDGGLPRRALHDRGRRRRAADRGPDPAPPGRGQRPREGRAPRRRLGDRRGLRGGLDRRRADHRRGPRAQRGRAHHDPPHARRGAAARQGPLRRAVRRGGRDRLGGLLSDRRWPGAGRLQAPPRRSLTTRALRRATARALSQEA